MEEISKNGAAAGKENEDYNARAAGEIKAKLFWLAGVSLPLVALDQITKAMAKAQISLGELVPVIPGFFDLTHIHNTGGAFGIFADNSAWIRAFLFLGMSVLAAGLVLVLLYKTPSRFKWMMLAFSLVFSGAVGNLIDRFRYGYVEDFLYFQLAGYRWPAFNVADSAVTVGVTLLVIQFVFNKELDL